MIKGGCYCGAVRYEIHGALLRFLNCHCPDCRKFSGSAFAAVLATEANGFQVVRGEDQLTPYSSSPGKQRLFCRTCGCHLFARAENRPGLVLVRAGTLDDDPPLRPEAHIWVSAKAPWYEITDRLPQFAEGMTKPATQGAP